MRNQLFLIVLTVIWISGCEPYDFRKDIYLTSNTDKFEGYTETYIWGMDWLENINGGHYPDYLIPKKILFENGDIIYRLRYEHDYHSLEGLYPEQLIFLLDGERYRLNFSGSNRDGYFSDYGTYFGKEWAWVNVESSFLEKIANANEVQFRVVGSDESFEYVFNERYRYCFKRFYNECVLNSQNIEEKL